LIALYLIDLSILNTLDIFSNKIYGIIVLILLFQYMILTLLYRNDKETMKNIYTTYTYTNITLFVFSIIISILFGSADKLYICTYFISVLNLIYVICLISLDVYVEIVN